MSPDIWTLCAGLSRVVPLACKPWRVVEAQHKNSTRKLVDTLEEQIILEQVIEEIKPPAPTGPRFDRLDYLLSTPFRYPPLRRGSRFGSPTERSLWYGAIDVDTSLAEKAYHQLLFVAGSPISLKDLSCEWSAFQASVKTERGVDLGGAAFASYRRQISSPSTYEATQRLGTAMRTDGIEAFFYPSARCPKRGTAIGMFEPAFAQRKPVGVPTTWEFWLTTDGCETIHRSPTRVLKFRRQDFEVGGRLPAPGLGLS